MNASFKQAFPELETEGFDETSPMSGKYNCIAWAAGAQTEWWWPYQHPDYYWPEGQPREVTIDALVRAFTALGYERCEDGNLEATFEKVVIYTKAAPQRTRHGSSTMDVGRASSARTSTSRIRFVALRGLRTGRLRFF